ncbi:hypothetical protein GW17_00016532 [Ensete ventricosum]|nr:hypothetical protein GW17_00016532 [Ensete ventricosum]
MSACSHKAGRRGWSKLSGLVRPCSAPNAVPTLACKVAAAGHGGRCSYYVVGESTQRRTVTYARANARIESITGPTSKPAKASRRKRSVSKLSGKLRTMGGNSKTTSDVDGARIAAAPEDRKPTSAAALFAGRGDAGRLPRVAELKARRAQRLAAEEDINEVADAFIRRFREDLHLESIDNYNQMLARGL